MNFLFKGEILDYDFINQNRSKTILFLHGWGGDKNSFKSAYNLVSTKYNILSVTMPTIRPMNLAWELNDYAEVLLYILKLLSIEKVSIVCHSFGFRVACLLNGEIEIERIVVTGGAGLKKTNIFRRVIMQNNRILLSDKKNAFLYNQIASKDYKNLDKTTRETFKNVVNFNSKNFIKFACPMLLFWGKYDIETPLWCAKKIRRKNNAKLVTTSSGHFAYLDENALFKNKIKEFLC